MFKMSMEEIVKVVVIKEGEILSFDTLMLLVIRTDQTQSKTRLHRSMKMHPARTSNSFSTSRYF
jgi:hypothetical protein